MPENSPKDTPKRFVPGFTKNGKPVVFNRRPRMRYRRPKWSSVPTCAEAIIEMLEFVLERHSEPAEFESDKGKAIRAAGLRDCATEFEKIALQRPVFHQKCRFLAQKAREIALELEKTAFPG